SCFGSCERLPKPLDFGSLTGRATLGRVSQRLDFLSSQWPGLAFGQPAKVDGADGNALQPHHLVREACKHAANLAVLAFIKNNAQPGAFALFFQALDMPGVNMALAEPDALAELGEILAGGRAGHLYEVALLHAEARVHELVSQVAIIGQEQETLAV